MVYHTFRRNWAGPARSTCTECERSNMFAMTPKVSTVVVTFNSREDILDCLGSVLREKVDDHELLVVDNASRDGTADLVRSQYPEVRVIANRCNLGAAGGFNAGLKAARGRYIALLNPDTIVQPGWLTAMLEVMEKDATIGACQSRIMLHDQPTMLNTEGIDINYLGFAWCRNYGVVPGQDETLHETLGLSGCSVMFSAEALEAAGFFDDDFFMYLEDVDLGLRLAGCGFRVVCNSKSIVHHKYRFHRGNEKMYYLERNRLMMLLKNYSGKDLAKVAPPLFLMEAGIIFLSLFQGWLPQKVASYAWLIKNLNMIIGKRRSTPRCSSQVLALMSPVITFEQVQNPFLTRLVNPVLRVYYRWAFYRGKGQASRLEAGS